MARFGIRCTIFTGVILLLGGGFFAVNAQVDTGWVRRVASPGTDMFNAVTVDRAGNIYAAGYGSGPVSNNSDFLVAKYAPDGAQVWLRYYDGPGNGGDFAYGVAVDSRGNVYVTGYVTTRDSGYDFCTVKFDSTGNQLWARFYDGGVAGDDRALGIAVDLAGNVYVTGYSAGSGTGYDYCTIKYDAQGVLKWIARYNGPANASDIAQAVAVDGSNNVYVTGYSTAGNADYLTIKYNSDGVQQWAARYNGEGNGADYATRLCVDPAGDCYVTGYSWGAGTADYDCVTIKYSKTGAREWVARYNGAGNDNDYGRAVVVDANGNVLVAGASTGTGTSVLDALTLKYDGAGNLLWARTFDGALGVDYLIAVALDSSGNCYVTGYSQRPGSGADILTICYSGSGDLRWQVFHNEAASGNDYPSGVALDRSGNVYIAGYGRAGPGTGDDALLIKYVQPDAAVRRITFPVGRVDTADAVIPRAVVANAGSAPRDIRVFFWIARPSGTRVYSDSVTLTLLPAGDSLQVTFSEWLKPHALGFYECVCSTYCFRDGNPGNNVARMDFQVTAGPYGWTEVGSVPLAPSGRAVKDGGALTYCTARERIYCVKGNRTGDFYYYTPGAGTWVTLPTIPNGPSGKTPGKGACVVSDGDRYLYLVRGNKTLEFWRFDVDSATWTQMPDIPGGPKNRPVKGGADAVFVPAENAIYLLKGYRNEFYRYLITTDEWQALPDAPLPAKPKWDNGSFLVFDGENSLYAGKAKYNELWRYDRITQTWDTLRRLQPLPFTGRTGRNVKLKDGGCAVYYEGLLYVLKGSNSCEFWCYDVAGDSWFQLEDMPEYGCTGKRKRVKAGGDMVFGGDALYALKGNKTVEFWRYAISPGADGKWRMANGQWGPIPHGQRRWEMANGQLGPIPHWLYPNSFLERMVRVTVFDAAGRVRVDRCYATPDAVGEILKGLGSGVYILRLEAKGRVAFARGVFVR